MAYCMYCAGVYDRDSYSVKEIITEIILLSFKEEIYFKNFLITFPNQVFSIIQFDVQMTLSLKDYTEFSKIYPIKVQMISGFFLHKDVTFYLKIHICFLQFSALPWQTIRNINVIEA